MKYEDIPELRPCPMCGSEAHLRKNASKRFQVKCKKCKCCTMWTSKTMAVVLWYNNAEKYIKLQEAIKNGNLSTIRATNPAGTE